MSVVYALFTLFTLLYCTGCMHMDDFYDAARQGNIEVMNAMLSSGLVGSIHRRDSKGNTAIIIAAGRGQVSVLQMLLSYGAHIEDTTKGGLLAGKSVLCWAASQGREHAVSYLIEAGANINRATEDGVFQGKTPLMWASSQGKKGVVSILIHAGADIDFASRGGNFKGKTSLMWASSQGRVDVVITLLEAGASVDLVDNDGVSALMWATGSEGDNDESQSKGLFIKAMKGHNDVVKALLHFGASLDLTDKDGITALMYACFHGHEEAVITLLNAGADASLRNNAGRTAIFLAGSSGHLNVVGIMKAGPTIMSLPLNETKEVSICGWLLHILRSTEGKQFAHIRRTQYTAANSCQDLQKVGLGATMGFMLEILEVTTVDELVEQLGITNNFAAKMLARKQLHHIRKRFIEKEVCNLNNSTLERIVDS